MSLRKTLGLSRGKWDELEFIVKTTREQYRHLIAGMRWKPRTDEYVIIFVDRTGIGHQIAATSKDLGTKDKQLEVYSEVMHYFELPHHCHECKFSLTGEAGFFDDEDEDDVVWDTSTEDSWLDEDEDDEGGWDTGEDDDEGWG